MPLLPLYLDEDVSVIIAAILRARGFDVLNARDTGRLGRSDREQLQFATSTNRALLTHNRTDFEQLHKEWLEAGKNHSGIIIVRRRQPKELTTRVGQLLVRLPSDMFRNQLFYS